MKNPLISVVIPVYNRGVAIKATIESVLSQTWPQEQLEIIIVDDGSTDDTLSFLQIEYSNHPHIRLFSQPNAGVACARNKGLNEARGDFIAFLDHDDLWLPQKLEKQVARFRASPTTTLVYCGWQTRNENGPPSNGIIFPTQWPRGAVYRRLLQSNFLISASVPLMRTRIIREAGGFAPNAVPNDDWDLWLRLAQTGRFDCVAEPLVLYQQHSAQLSRASQKMIETTRNVFQRQHSFVAKNRRFWLPWKIFSTLTMSYQRTFPLFVEAQNHLFAGRFLQAVRCWLRAFSSPAAPFSRQWLYLLKRALCRDLRPY